MKKLPKPYGPNSLGGLISGMAVAVKVKDMDDSEAAVDAPTSVKHGISHVSHALKVDSGSSVCRCKI